MVGEVGEKLVEIYYKCIMKSYWMNMYIYFIRYFKVLFIKGNVKKILKYKDKDICFLL